MGVNILEWWCFQGQRLRGESSQLIPIPLFSQNHLSRPAVKKFFHMYPKPDVIGGVGVESGLSDWLLGVSQIFKPGHWDGRRSFTGFS